MKKTIMGKVEIMVLLSLLVVLFVSNSVMAEGDGYTACDDYDFRYTEKDDGLYITGLVGDDFTSIIIPETIDGKTVVGINDNAFSGYSNMVSAVIPDSVTNIGEGAFKGTSLKSITLPFIGTSSTTSDAAIQSVFGIIFGYDTSTSSTGIENAVNQAYFNNVYYFYYIPKTLKNVKITNATQIPLQAFRNCDFIEDIELNEGIETIKSRAFEHCTALKEMRFPDSVKEMGDQVLNECSNLQKANIPSSMNKVPGWLFRRCTSLKEVEMHDRIETIGYCAFGSCTKIESIELSDNVKTIEGYAFTNCNELKNINVRNVTSIGENAFYGCKKISKIDFSDQLTSIGKNAFEGCSNITEIVVPDSVTSIGECAFKGTSLESISLPFVGLKPDDNDVVQSVFGIIFGYDTSESSTGIEGTTYQIYTNNKYHLYYIPRTIKTVKITKASKIPSKAFHNCDFIENIELNEGIESIYPYAFLGCSSLKSINIPNSTNTLYTQAFSGCEFLERIVVPDSVQTIDSGVFHGCTNIIICASKGSVAYRYAINNSLAFCSTKNISLYSNSLTIYIDDEKSLTATVTMFNDNADPSPKIKWSSSDENVAEVSNGKISTKGLGKTIITVSCEGCSDSCEVVVCNPPTPAPTVSPTVEPTNVPLVTPTEAHATPPIMEPTNVPIETPTAEPTNSSTVEPTNIPIETPTTKPTSSPEVLPTNEPTSTPTANIDSQKIVVTLDGNGVKLLNNSVTVDTNGHIKLPKPMRTGYIFIGWYTDKNGGEQITESTVFEHNTTIYALWADNSQTEEPTATPTAVSTPISNSTPTIAPSEKASPTVTPSVSPTPVVEKDNKTTFSIKNKKTIKKTSKVKVKDKDKIKKITLNGKKIKIKSNKTSVTVKLKSYKKYLKKKGKWNTIKVTDKKGNKKTIKFKIK